MKSNFINGKVIKVGNSLGVLIPNTICEDLKITKGNKIKIQVITGNIDKEVESFNTVITKCETMLQSLPDVINGEFEPIRQQINSLNKKMRSVEDMISIRSGY